MTRPRCGVAQNPESFLGGEVTSLCNVDRSEYTDKATAYTQFYCGSILYGIFPIKISSNTIIFYIIIKLDGFLS